MKSLDPILFRELPLIQKIIQDETWLEGERRGCHVTSDDRVVRDKVCQIILRIGQQLRETATAAIASQCSSGGTQIPFPGGNEAA